MAKTADAFRTISEVADELELQKHVLRFWEVKFPQIRPMKRGGGRRYYRPADLDLLRGIRQLLHADGYTIKGVQRILREKGIDAVKKVGEAAHANARPAAGDAKERAGGGVTVSAPSAASLFERAAGHAGADSKEARGGSHPRGQRAGQTAARAMASTGAGSVRSDSAAERREAALPFRSQLERVIDELQDCRRLLVEETPPAKADRGSPRQRAAG